VVLVATFAACANYGSSVIDFEPPSTPKDASVDATVPLTADAQPIGDAAPARLDADSGAVCPFPNLLLNPDFESGEVNWNPPSPNLYSVVGSSSAHRGTMHGRICLKTPASGNSSYLLNQTLPPTLPSGNYTLRGWFRLESGGSQDAKPLLLNINNNAPSAETQQYPHDSVNWTCKSLSVALQPRIIQVGFGLLMGEQMCLNIDDLALYETTSLDGGLPPGCGCD
jgi:hypothetical protein